MVMINAARGGRFGRLKGITILTGYQSDWPTAQRRVEERRYTFINNRQRRVDAGGWILNVSKARTEFEGWSRNLVVGFAGHPNRRKGNDADPVQTLRQRLDNANNHFRKKAAEVFGDGDAVRLLARLYQAVIVDIADFDACKDGVSLAKLTAANFCEIGAKSIYITEAGQNFIDAINSDE